MSKRARRIVFAVVAGAIALLLWMPFKSPCLLVMDRSAMPIQLAASEENPFGMIICHDFRSAFWVWAAVLVFVALVSSIGYVIGRATVGAVVAGSSLTLAIIGGHIVYPWFDAYWGTAVESSLAVAAAAVFGAGGGWLASKKAQQSVQPDRREDAAPG
ncbi:MAG TPA: hypothetical protein VFS24_04560 [Steroidobacteraceae bacterium]|nr:hypothetical protein [Steroidobacteraceae bacterium]